MSCNDLKPLFIGAGVVGATAYLATRSQPRSIQVPFTIFFGMVGVLAGNYIRSFSQTPSTSVPNPPPANLESQTTTLPWNVSVEPKSELKDPYLSSLTQDELQAVRAFNDQQLLGQCLDCVKNNTEENQGSGWKGLITMYQQKKDVHTMLIRLYNDQKINIQELATAFIFLSPAASGQVFTIAPFSSIATIQDVQSRFLHVENIPQHLLFVVTTAIRQFPEEYRETLRNRLFVGFIKQHRGLLEGGPLLTGVSAALMERDSLLNGGTIIWKSGLSRRCDMYENMLNLKNDFALFTPQQSLKYTIHGLPCVGFFSVAHDAYHAWARGRATWEWQDLILLGQAVEELIEQSNFYKSSQQYEIQVINGENHLLFNENASQLSNSDRARYIAFFLLSEASGRILDGEIVSNPGIRKATQLALKPVNKFALFIIGVNEAIQRVQVNTVTHQAIVKAMTEILNPLEMEVQLSKPELIASVNLGLGNVISDGTLINIQPKSCA